MKYPLIHYNKQSSLFYKKILYLLKISLTMKLSVRLLCILFFVIATGFNPSEDIIIIDQGKTNRYDETEVRISSKYYRSARVQIFEINQRVKRLREVEDFTLREREYRKVPLDRNKRYEIIVTDYKLNKNKEVIFRRVGYLRNL